MATPAQYRIVIRGAAGARALRPFLDDFVPSVTGDGDMCLTGVVRDAAHLHGLLVHLTSLNAELISVTQITEPEGSTP
jgi:hypothetical protein